MLTLPIKKYWFDMIVAGIKEDEYREIKPYYDSRLLNLFGAIWVDGELLQGQQVPEEIRKKPIQCIKFRNGYSADAPEITALCSLRTGEGREEWGAVPGKKYYILGIKEIIRFVRAQRAER